MNKQKNDLRQDREETLLAQFLSSHMRIQFNGKYGDSRHTHFGPRSLSTSWSDWAVECMCALAWMRLCSIPCVAEDMPLILRER